MRYEKGHKEETRQHILDIASKQFRKGGIEAVGLAAVMKDAGLTNGAFYAHFKSKEDLVREVLASTFDKQIQTFTEALKNGFTIEDAIREYLSPKQRDQCEKSCPAASLMAEIARHTKATRNIFNDKVQKMLDLFSNQIKEGDPAKKRRKAIAIYAQLVGSIQLARVATDKEESDRILESGIEAALDMVTSTTC
ncbi:MAG: TetR family transcriptional regulator [Bdellovibrionales bacterium RIFCSPHIGHO2_01_FULL_40_29]|nr:MAG: TetR family transcriptional regulator [Bdellovibrionales bacterium RIFCSPHIGHO2_01_FULL_40_29]OFZ34838.1 MAG: TetR family transcriptional regulator [Bdellovibrionales bacterium RIFCSPHIGHO2_02_FULL_40_15]